MGKSSIEWTDETWNPVTGCDRISPGCANCYARTMAKRLKAMGNPRYQVDGDGSGFGVTMHWDLLEEPRHWRKPRRVFVNSMSDLFHEEVSDEFIGHVFVSMALAPEHTFQVLTKRPERARELLGLWHRDLDERPWVYGGTSLPNVWLGVSIENARHTWRADVLREIPAAVRFISAEPLLGSLYNTHGPGRRPLNLDGIDQVIIGGESGPGARVMDADWAVELVQQCDRHGVAPFVKQLGTVAGRVLGAGSKGQDFDMFPEVLRRREFPTSTLNRSEAA